MTASSHTAIYVVFLLSLSLIVSCKNVQNKQQPAAPSDPAIEAVADSSELVSFDEGTELDLQYFSGPFEINRYFGWEHGLLEDGALPDIPGLCYQTAGGRHLAIRCPSQKHILRWASGRVKIFADWCLNGPGDTIPSIVPFYENPQSGKDIVNHYLRCITKGQQEIMSEPSDTAIYYEQFAKLIVDAYRTDKYVTMQEYTWYDFGSCGDNTSRSWFTLDKGGHVLELSDIIDEVRWQEFAYIMLRHLNSYIMPWFDYSRETRYCDLVPLLNDRDGCALTPEGVVIYYHPYKIGCGAEGQYNALVPYNELEGMLKTKM